MPQSKSKVRLLGARLLQRGKDSNIKALIVIDITVAAVIVTATVVVMMDEFCGGLWLRPLSQDIYGASSVTGKDKPGIDIKICEY